MDHPLPAPEALVRPWRTATAIAVTIAALELLLLLLIGGKALAGWAADRVRLEAQERVLAPTAARPSATPVRRTRPAPVASLPRRKTIVLVLNGNGRTGAAASAASRVRARGYRVGAVGNASRSDFARSLVMYRPGFAGEGRRLAQDLGVRVVGPLDGMRRAALGRAHLVFILGR